MSVEKLIESRPLFADMRPAFNERPAIKVNDFIYYSDGSSNANMVVCGKQRVIINTGMGFEAIIAHKPAFDAVAPLPTHTIITTQGHVDHVGGVRHFRESGTRYLAQAKNLACQHDDALIRKRRESQADIWFHKILEAAMEVAKTRPETLVQDTPTPDEVFEDEFSFEVEGMKFELYSVPGGETVDSCAVWLPQHGIVFTGNQFGPLFPHFPNLNTLRGDKYRWMEPYLSSLLRVKELAPELLITGHFEPIEGKALIQDCLQRLHDAAQYVFEATMKGMAEGKDVYTLMREITLPKSLTVGQNYGKVSWAVRTLWESHMGWFKAQNSSELYGTTPHDVFKDLLELAGLPAVLERCKQHLKEGSVEQAMLLAEATLSYDAKSAEALTLAIEAHRALLARPGADNFWEAGWLRWQLQKLEQRLAE